MNKEILENCDSKIKSFSLENNIYECKVVSVYDGDSCKVVFPLNGNLYKWNVRMDGYDTPEMRPKRNNPHREAEKAAAIESRDFLKSLIMSSDKQLVFIKCGKFDKYGRLLGTIFLGKEDIEDVDDKGDTKKLSVNETMIIEGYGYAYDGGTKKKFTVS